MLIEHSFGINLLGEVEASFPKLFVALFFWGGEFLAEQNPYANEAYFSRSSKMAFNCFGPPLQCFASHPVVPIIAYARSILSSYMLLP